MTVLETIQKSSDFLVRKGVESPRLQTELLLAHVLGLPRMKLYLGFERQLSPDEIAAMRELVKRRGQREPLQHIVGSTSFCGVEIAVNPHVLIPRPETEILAELAWQFLWRLKAPDSDPGRVLDYGTGSGCIAIAIAVKCPQAQIVALDASADALAVARQNAAANGASERLRFVQGKDFKALPAEQRFDLLVSNPPYIPSAEIESLQPEVRDYEPRPALDGGPDGLRLYRLFAADAAPFLKPEGRLMVEFGDGQAQSIQEVFESQNWIVETVNEDYTQRPRFLIARRE